MDTTMKPTTAILERIRQNSGKNQDEVFTRLFRYLLRPDLYYLRDEKQKLQLESAGRDV